MGPTRCVIVVPTGTEAELERSQRSHLGSRYVVDSNVTLECLLVVNATPQLIMANGSRALAVSLHFITSLWR